MSFRSRKTDLENLIGVRKCSGSEVQSANWAVAKGQPPRKYNQNSNRKRNAIYVLRRKENQADKTKKKQSQKTVGSFNLVQVEDGLEAFTLRLFTTVLGWQLEEVQVLLANVRKDIRDPKIHAQFDL